MLPFSFECRISGADEYDRVVARATGAEATRLASRVPEVDGRKVPYAREGRWPDGDSRALRVHFRLPRGALRGPMREAVSAAAALGGLHTVTVRGANYNFADRGGVRRVGVALTLLHVAAVPAEPAAPGR